MSDFQKEVARGTRIMYLFTALPFVIIGAIFLAGRVPDRWRNLYFLGVAVAALSIIFAVPIREALRQEKRQGLVPRTPGFSGKVLLVAEKLRERANELETDGEDAGGVSPTFAAYVAEVRRVAKAQDKHDVLSGLTLELPKKNLPGHIAHLRKKAEEAELYAHSIRTRGGIFRMGVANLVAAVALLIAGFLYGWRLVLQNWSTPSWSFFGGVALIVSTIVLAIGIVKSRRDPA
jgi:MFS family permease